MQMLLDRDPLFEALQQLQAIVEKKNTVQILSNILCSAEKGSLSLYATDLEVGMKITVPADVKEPGKLTIAAKHFFEIVKELDSGTIQITRKNNNWIELVAGKSRFQVVSLPAEDYPAIPDFAAREYFPTQGDSLVHMVENTAFAVSTDATRYLLNGIYLENMDEGKMRMTATDGHRLSFMDQVMFEKAPLIKKGIILPRKGLQEIRKLIEAHPKGARLAFDKGYVFAQAGDTFLSVRLMEGEYPDYRQVIPKSADKEAKIPLEAFHSALKRVSLLSHEKTRGVKLQLQPGTLTISSSNPDVGEAREELDVDYQGETLEIGFNARYLMECLAIMKGKETTLRLKDKQSPGILQSKDEPDHTYVIMPMRLA